MKGYNCHKIMTNKTTDYFQFLSFADLTPEQIKVYSVLLQHKELPAGIIARKVELGRSFVYKIIDQLVELQLVEKIEQNGLVMRFKPVHPKRILELMAKKRENVEKSYELIEAELGKIISQYNLTENKPSLRFFEGLDGLRQVHKGIIAAKSDFKLIRSFLDKKDSGQHEIIRNQVKKEVSLGLRKQIVGPLPDGQDTNIPVLKQKDTDRFVNRKVIDDLNIPTQIMIYGNKVAITDYKNNVITTIIESESVKETFEKIFDFMYRNGRDAY